MYIKDYFKRLLDPVIALATLSNVCTILVILGLVGDAMVNNITKIGTIVIATLIQLGVMKQPDTTK
jgi:ACR3 family arsenite efflux pump ArsB